MRKLEVDKAYISKSNNFMCIFIIKNEVNTHWQFEKWFNVTYLYEKGLEKDVIARGEITENSAIAYGSRELKNKDLALLLYG